jgi:hypothetical protein
MKNIIKMGDCGCCKEGIEPAVIPGFGKGLSQLIPCEDGQGGVPGEAEVVMPGGGQAIDDILKQLMDKGVISHEDNRDPIGDAVGAFSEGLGQSTPVSGSRSIMKEIKVVNEGGNSTATVTTKQDDGPEEVKTYDSVEEALQEYNAEPVDALNMLAGDEATKTMEGEEGEGEVCEICEEKEKGEEKEENSIEDEIEDGEEIDEGIEENGEDKSSMLEKHSPAEVTEEGGEVEEGCVKDASGPTGKDALEMDLDIVGARGRGYYVHRLQKAISGGDKAEVNKVKEEMSTKNFKIPEELQDSIDSMFSNQPLVAKSEKPTKTAKK